MNLDQVLRTFIAESRELLETMERDLLQAETNAADPETLNAIFRAAHTIKGGAGLFGLNHVVSFTHVVENALDALRSGRLALDPALVALLLSSRDHVSALLDTVEAGEQNPDEEREQAGNELLEQLRAYLPAEAPAAAPMGAPVAVTVPAASVASAPVFPPSLVGAAERSVSAEHWHISLRFGRDLLRNGMDPLSFIRYLEKIGKIAAIETIADELPGPDEMDAEACYVGFEIALQSDSEKAAIEGVFDFVRENSTIHILPPKSRISEYKRLIEELPEETARLGEILVRCGTLTAHELEEALNEQRKEPERHALLGDILIARHSVQPPVVEAALAKQQRVEQLKIQESRSIRVDSDKLDTLINLVGELIIAAASTDMVARRAQLTELQSCTGALAALVEQVRDSALQLRMVKIGSTFNRFQRVVHDVSQKSGKDIGLVVSGEDTELDKTVVEQIGDPLLHLVRNAIDHGIEPREIREQRGKPLKGTVRLNAYHDSGNIVIEVSDDGGGLKRDKILAKAIERGLVEPGATLSDSEVFALVFEPGFSTAEVVTDLSGRGVGMDVVKRNITTLRGSVAIKSEEGVGTTISIRLPLTLAIINGFLVGLDESVFVLPLEAIEECVELSSDAGLDYTNLRGQVLPFIRLRELFGLRGAATSRENIVVVKYGSHRVGIVVDKLLGEFQTVIKPLSKLFSRVKCINGSSILGTGEVALILDVPTLVQEAARVPAGALN